MARRDAGQPELRVEYVPTAELTPYAGNAKEHPEWQVSEIAESIKQFGFSDPVGAWHNPETGEAEIVEGHGRLLAARELGMGTVPVVWLDHLDDEGRRAYGLAHNQLTMNTDWDQDALDAELDSLDDIDMSRFGFERNGFSVLDDLEGNEFVAKAEAAMTSAFSVSLAFPSEERETVMSWWNKGGKEKAVEFVEEAAGCR